MLSHGAIHGFTHFSKVPKCALTSPIFSNLISTWLLWLTDIWLCFSFLSACLLNDLFCIPLLPLPLKAHEGIRKQELLMCTFETISRITFFCTYSSLLICHKSNFLLLGLLNWRKKFNEKRACTHTHTHREKYPMWITLYWLHQTCPCWWRMDRQWWSSLRLLLWPAAPEP